MIDYLEDHIPEMAQAAIKLVYWQVLASDSSVLVGETVSSMKFSRTEPLNSSKTSRRIPQNQKRAER